MGIEGFDTLRYEVADNGVATITLDQPDTRNALSADLLDDLIAAFTLAGADTGVRCVVLTSSHERVFSSGANLAGFSAEVPLVHKHFGTDKFPTLFRLIGELGKPTICAANGHVLAGALGIALACDLILARDGARFGTPESPFPTRAPAPTSTCLSRMAWSTRAARPSPCQSSAPCR